MTVFTRMALALFLSLALGAGQALAAADGGGTSAKQDNPAYAQAVKLVEAGDYAGAVPLLKKLIAAEHVQHEQRRDGEAEPDLRGLPGGHLEAPAPVQRPEREPDMYAERAVQQDAHGQVAPEQQEPPAPGLQRVEGNQPERVVEQVREQVAEEDQARDQMQAADHGFPPKPGKRGSLSPRETPDDKRGR